MAEIRALLFDKDGTLFGFAATWGDWTAGFLTRLAGSEAGARAAAADIGFDFDRRRHRPDSPVVAGALDEWLALLLPHAPEHDAASLLALLKSATDTARQVPAAPLAPLMARFRAHGLALGIATNASERAARHHMAHQGVVEAFDFIAGYDSGHGAKPAPGMLTAFAGAVGFAPAQVLMVGDSLHDMAAAKAAGMPALGVLTGAATAEVLAPHAVAVLPSIADLPDWLGLSPVARAV